MQTNWQREGALHSRVGKHDITLWGVAQLISPGTHSAQTPLMHPCWQKKGAAHFPSVQSCT
jgi:hypothetical protein